MGSFTSKNNLRNSSFCIFGFPKLMFDENGSVIFYIFHESSKKISVIRQLDLLKKISILSFRGLNALRIYIFFRVSYTTTLFRTSTYGVWGGMSHAGSNKVFSTSKAFLRRENIVTTSNVAPCRTKFSNI